MCTPGKPEIFNNDQGSQFTSIAFTGALIREGVVTSMDGRGRAFDDIFVERPWRDVKHEDVYLKGYATMGELMVGLAKYFVFYNGERPHLSLDYRTPDVVYRTALGGGALIVDKFGGAWSKPLFRYVPQGFAPPQKQDQKQQQKQKQRQHRGSAVQLLVKSNVQLKLSGCLS